MPRTKQQLEAELAEKDELLEEVYNKLGDVLGYEEDDDSDDDGDYDEE